MFASLLSLPTGSVANAQLPADSRASTYNDQGELLPPTEYRNWIFLSSGLDMSYNKKFAAMGHSLFTNVFVNPEAYREFLRIGTWPDKTVLVIEVRAASAKGSINEHGRYQSGRVMGMEVHVKDTARFKTGWAFFDVPGAAPAPPQPATADCYVCHEQHAAVDTTFVQFYPTLIELATAKRTLSEAYRHEQRSAARK